MKLRKFWPAMALAVGATAAVAAVTDGALSSDGRSIEVRTDRGTLHITPLTNDIFRVTVAPDDARGAKYLPSQAAVLKNPFGDVRVTAAQRDVTISSPTTSVVVNRKTGRVSFFDKDGRPLLQEADGLDNRGEVKTITFLNPGDQQFFGAGERGHKLNLNGDTLVMYNRQNYGYTGTDPRISQMNITMPYVASDAGYGLLVDDHNMAQLILGDTIKYVSENPPSLLSYYFINGGGDLAGTTERFTQLTGRQELPPLWTLGYITSKYGYRDQAETLGVIDTLKTRGYPVDGIVLDLYWYGKETDMGRLEWNPEQWPDPKGMLAKLRKEGVNLVPISQPYINKIGALDQYKHLTELGYLTRDAQGDPADVTTWVGEAGMFDVSNPGTRKWLWNRYHSLTEDGIAGWWGDLGEPEVHPGNIVHNNGMTARQYHNVYGNEWSRILYEGFAQAYPERRSMLLMRGGTTGLQRYNVFPWSTDVSRSWGGLEPQVRIMLGSGLSGLGYMSSDIGGFAVDPKHPTDSELYVRWLEMGTFTPMLRTHAQLKPEPYHYPEVEDISKRFIKMRYEWLPYNYTLAFENALKGLPLARPLNFNGKNTDKKYTSLSDEYLWGNDVLVAPVMKKGARSRSVLFPDGEWIDWNNPALKYKGGTKATVRAPLGTLPLFVRAGAFIPQCTKEIENTTQYDPSQLTVRYFPSGAESSYTLYDDDRTSRMSLSDGAYRLINFTGKRDGRNIYITIKTTGKEYAGMSPVINFTFEIVGVKTTPKSVSIDGKPLAKGTYTYNARTATLTFPLAYKDAASIEIR